MLTDERLEELRWAAETSHFDDTAAALVELQERRAKDAVRGTFACPRCGVGRPHVHDPSVRQASVSRLVDRFRNSPSQSDAWSAVDRLAAMALEADADELAALRAEIGCIDERCDMFDAPRYNEDGSVIDTSTRVERALAKKVRSTLLVGLERGKREKAEAKLESFKRMYDAEITKQGSKPDAP